MKNIIITGGAGFIGSHLCTYFVNGGYNVTCIDNLSTGRYRNIKLLEKHKNFHFINCDIIKKIKQKIKADYILHFASPASPIDYLEKPIETLRVGSIGTQNMLELAKANNARFLLASTSEIYGDPLIHPQKETYWGNVNPIGPRGVYDEAKRFAEAITIAYRNKYKINTAIVRIFNTYGENMRINDGRAIPNFIVQALSNKDLTIYGNGKQTRSVCYVSDTVDGIVKVLLSDIKEPINIGNPSEVTVLELANEIISLLESKSKIKFYDLPKDDPKVRCPDIELARTKIGWEPKIKRDVGLLKTALYFSREISA